MNLAHLNQLLACGEDSRNQFKRDVTHADSLAAELAALANSGGGYVLLGVADDFLLRMDALVDLCARHYFCEGCDPMKILVYRRVAWHIDAIAKNTNKD